MIRKALFALLFAACLPTACASVFGQASGYNIFVFGNDTQSGSDVGGRTAIGGNYSGSTNFGSATNDKAGTYDVVVGGNFSLSNDAVSAGDVYVGGNATLTSSSAAHNVTTNGSFTAQYSSVYGNLDYATTYSLNGVTIAGTTQKTATSPPIDFAGTQASLQTLTGMLNSQALTGTSLIAYNSITLTATSGLNIFNISAANLASNSGLTINAALGAVNPTVVINVTGGQNHAYSFASAGYQLNGLSAGQVLYNFADATSILQSGSAVQGSILAPYATFSFSNGQVDGQIFANSISGNGEAHNDLFTGSLPAAGGAAVPEPATILSIGTVLILAAGSRWIARARPLTSLPTRMPRSAGSARNPNADTK